MNLEKGEIVLYEEADGSAIIDVRLHNETVWLSLNQMAELFGRDKSVISRHLRNVFDSSELIRKAVVAKNATTASDGKIYQIDYYNFDTIISVGYRVNSKKGTNFRIWATSVLKDHLVKGYTVNQKRLAEKGIAEASQILSLLQNTMIRQNMVGDEGQDILDLVCSYSKTWQLLWKYDEDSLPIQKSSSRSSIDLGLVQTRMAINSLKQELKGKGEVSEIFGQERGEGLTGILGAIGQTFGGQDLYQTVFDKAAHLLYFVIKDHPFIDGNKRIGSFLFLLFLHLNKKPFSFDPNTMVVLTLLVAASEAKQKDLLVRLIVNLLEE
jgi:death-on-curing family protein